MRLRIDSGSGAILEANGIDSEADEILLRREIGANGKGRVFVNNQPATVGVLRQLAPELALVHSQGETLGSFDQAQQRSLLDRFAAIEHGCGCCGVRGVARDYRQIEGAAVGGAGSAADG